MGLDFVVRQIEAGLHCVDARVDDDARVHLAQAHADEVGEAHMDTGRQRLDIQAERNQPNDDGNDGEHSSDQKQLDELDGD